MDKLKLAFLLTIICGVVAALASILLPLPEQWQGSWIAFHAQIMIAILLPLLHILAALYFFQGLRGFKQELKSAYRLIAFGVVLIGFALVQSSIVSIFNLWYSPYLTTGVLTLPYIVAMLVIFAGVRSFFRVLDIQSRWRSLWPGILLIVIVVGLTILAPHKPQATSEWLFDLGQGAFALTASISLVVAINILVVRRFVAPSYAKALGWLAAGICIEVLLVGSSVPVRLLAIDTRESFGFLQNLLLFASIPYMQAGYLFYQLTADTRQVAQEQNATAVDVVLYVASLASNTQAIDPILDDVRFITARLQAGQTLTDADQAALGAAYLKLEAYLTQAERLRTFSVAQLRHLVREKFSSASISPLFWQQLPVVA